MQKNAPIGVLDSGVGGLSVLKCLQAALPQEDFIYVGDNVGDVAGMGADLYESYCGSILATAALGAAAFIHSADTVMPTFGRSTAFTTS